MSTKSRRAIWLLLTAVLAAILLIVTVCSSTTPIGQVLEQPALYDGSSVVVAGEVSDALGIVGWGAYTLRDNTGEIMVLTTSGCPRKGTRIRVRGRVRAAFTIQEHSEVVILQDTFTAAR